MYTVQESSLRSCWRSGRTRTSSGRGSPHSRPRTSGLRRRTDRQERKTAGRAGCDDDACGPTRRAGRGVGTRARLRARQRQQPGAQATFLGQAARRAGGPLQHRATHACHRRRGHPTPPHMLLLRRPVSPSMTPETASSTRPLLAHSAPSATPCTPHGVPPAKARCGRRRRWRESFHRAGRREPPLS